jgi:dTMP kinase
MLIVVEGLDACGKATQSKRLAEALGATRYESPSYDNHAGAPSGRFIGAHLRGAWAAQRLWDAKLSAADAQLLEPTNTELAPVPPLDAFVFQCLMAVNKLELATLFEADLAARSHVVLDRWWPSAYAYGVADGLDKEWLYRIHGLLPQPQLNLLLDIEPATSVARRPDRRDRYERQGAEFFQRLRTNYLELWHYAPKRLGGAWVVLDGSRSIDDVAEAVRAAVLERAATLGQPVVLKGTSHD